MHKQGGILLGTGGDNGNGSAGTFYEGVMTRGFPSEATTDAVQANVVAARYDVARVSLSRMTSFTPGSAQDVTETFTNTTGAPVTGREVECALAQPGSGRPLRRERARHGRASPGRLRPDASVSAIFQVTSPAATGAGFLSGKVEWKGSGRVG